MNLNSWSIQEISKKLKRFINDDAVFVSILLVLVGFGSFVLGQQSVTRLENVGTSKVSLLANSAVLVDVPQVGEKVTVSAVVEKALFFDDLNKDKIKNSLGKYGKEIGVENSHVKDLIDKKYCTLIFLKDVKEIQEDWEPEETGKTLAENAILKAKAYGQKSGLLTLADDNMR